MVTQRPRRAHRLLRARRRWPTHSDETRDAARARCCRIADDARDARRADRDVVHYDFSPYNVLRRRRPDHRRRRLGRRDERRRRASISSRSPLYTYDYARARRAARRRGRDAPIPRALALYAAHMVLRRSTGRSGTTSDVEVEWFVGHRDRPVWPRSALGRVDDVTTVPDAHAARARRRRVRVAATRRRVGREQRRRDRRRRRHHRRRHADGALAVGAVRGRGRAGSAARCAGSCSRTRTSTTSAVRTAFPNAIGARLAADERAARRRDAGRRVQGVHARVRPRSSTSSPRSAPARSRTSSPTPRSSRRGSSCCRRTVTPPAT